jgi:hypothetical protein
MEHHPQAQTAQAQVAEILVDLVLMEAVALVAEGLVLMEAVALVAEVQVEGLVLMEAVALVAEVQVEGLDQVEVAHQKLLSLDRLHQLNLEQLGPVIALVETVEPRIQLVMQPKHRLQMGVVIKVVLRQAREWVR